MQYETKKYKINKSKMGPVRQNPIQRTVRTAHLRVLMTVHNFGTQYNTDTRQNMWRKYVELGHGRIFA